MAEKRVLAVDDDLAMRRQDYGRGFNHKEQGRKI